MTFQGVLILVVPCLKLLTASRVGEYLSYSIKKQKIQPIPVSYLYLRYIFSQLSLMVSVSKYLKDTEDTAFHVSVSQIHFKSIFPNPDSFIKSQICQALGDNTQSRMSFDGINQNLHRLAVHKQEDVRRALEKRLSVSFLSCTGHLLRSRSTRPTASG